LKLEDIIPSNNIFHYRNKMEFSFADRRWLTVEDMNKEIADSNFALGFHLPGIFSKVLDIDECFLQSELSNKILNLTREFFKSKGTSIYSTRTHEGFLRNLVLRQSYSTDDLMVNLVTSNEDDDLIKEYSDTLVKSVPQITTIVNNINLKKAAIAVGDYEKIYLGSGTIFDSIGKYRFRISANSFFQTNTLQAEKLYETALDFADLDKDEIAYDLYSGAGTISIFISDHCKEVFAFETVESAIRDAGENNKLNNIENVHYITADLNKSFLEKTLSLPKPDVVILDPPRSGMNPVTVKDVAALSPKKIVYVSCNPTTQVRDIKLFTEEGYSLIKVKPVDMFPHTYHIENVALLIK
jgi:23S rRNA (uracil1939-C5)-methyltransferase